MHPAPSSLRQLSRQLDLQRLTNDHNGSTRRHQDGSVCHFCGDHLAERWPARQQYQGSISCVIVVFTVSSRSKPAGAAILPAAPPQTTVTQLIGPPSLTPRARAYNKIFSLTFLIWQQRRWHTTSSNRFANFLRVSNWTIVLTCNYCCCCCCCLACFELYCLLVFTSLRVVSCRRNLHN